MLHPGLFFQTILVQRFERLFSRRNNKQLDVLSGYKNSSTLWKNTYILLNLHIIFKASEGQLFENTYRRQRQNIFLIFALKVSLMLP